jgi:hypothetical protein
MRRFMVKTPDEKFSATNHYPYSSPRLLMNHGLAVAPSFLRGGTNPYFVYTCLLSSNSMLRMSDIGISISLPSPMVAPVRCDGQ